MSASSPAIYNHVKIFRGIASNKNAYLIFRTTARVVPTEIERSIIQRMQKNALCISRGQIISVFYQLTDLIISLILFYGER